LDLFIDLLINLAAAFVWLIFTLIWLKMIYPTYRRRKLRNLWGIEDDDVTIVVAATPSIDCKYRTKTDDCYWSTEHGPIVGYGDAAALGLVLDSIRSISKTINLNVILSTDIGSETKDDNLILIGGPVYNSLVRDILRLINSPVTFDKYSIVEHLGASSKKMNPAISDESIVYDYGLIIKTRNPFNPSKIVFIIAGCHDPGSVAAAQYVVSNLLKMKKRPTLFGLAVEAPVSNFYVANPQLVTEIHELKSEQ
jgi:hypothetical protein